MPIKNPKLYPKRWYAIRNRILNRSKMRCECTGECGLHSGKRCIEIHRAPAKYFAGYVILTIAHLDHNPGNNRSNNLKAMCQKCHLRYDSKHHQRNAYKTRWEKKANLELAITPAELYKGVNEFAKNQQTHRQN